MIFWNILIGYIYLLSLHTLFANKLAEIPGRLVRGRFGN